MRFCRQGFLQNFSTCQFNFDEEHLLNEFIDKYQDFKIYDDKGRVYPLHIDRAMYFDCQHIQGEVGKIEGEE